MKIDPESDAAPGELPLDLLEQAGVERFTYWREIDSTNSFALEQLAKQSAETPWLILAGAQTVGRGRGANRWWSERGSLTFSLVIDAEEMGIAPALWPRLSMGVGVALCQLLERAPWNLPLRLKWPNDLYIGGRKLSGILIENLGPRLVIGIGINVNQAFEGAPQEVQARATSLLKELGAPCDPYALLVDVVRDVLAILPFIAREEIDLSHEAGGRNELQWKPVVIRQGTTKIEGVCEGVDFDGALLIRTTSGLKRVLSGTVSQGG